MCGIAGFAWKELSRPADERLVLNMGRIQAHRGPDDEGVFRDGPLALGHRRLSILDLSAAGHQPMSSRDSRLTIVFNGEIYNFLELRDELQRLGHNFVSQTDTEVILHAYRQWGAECVQRFNGMWAFALFDKDQQRLLISRDRFGIKPFYYTMDNEAFAFASEIKAVLVARPAYRKVRRNYLARFLPSGQQDDGPETFFENIQSLPPAHNAWYDIRRGTLQISKYWTIDVEKFRQSWDGDPIERFADLLDSSVRLHIRSDVPVGSCLSGGLDSSVLVSLMSRHHHQPVRTFSGLYDDPTCNERSYVDQLNRHVPTIPFPVCPHPQGDLIDNLTSITWHQDEPTGGPGLYTQYHVMKRAHGEVKVLLDGQGSDELFAGYLPLFEPFMQDCVQQRPFVGRLQVLRLMLDASRFWPGNLKNGWKTILGPGLSNWLRQLKRRHTSSVTSPPEFLHPSLESCLNDEPIERPPLPSRANRLEDSLQELLVRNGLPALLHYEDRNSMAFSLEARVPFLDHRIVEFALGLDSSFKIRGSWTKWILRKVAERTVPREIAWRRSKMGYPTPMAAWFRQASDRDMVRDVLFSQQSQKREWLRKGVLEKLWTEHQAGRDHSWVLYRLLTTEIWHRHYIDAFQPAAVHHQPATACYYAA
jgi:asparagine synthase (glutamine-hydrolysing)